MSKVRISSGESGLIWLFILLFALAFCGTPDLHDAAIKYAHNAADCKEAPEDK